MKGKFYSIYLLIAALLLAVNSTTLAKDQDTKKSDKAAKTSAKTKINVNTADSATLQTLPGVGPSIAADIIAARPFKNVSELEKVPGIGKERLKDIRPLVSVKDAKANVGAAGSSTTGADTARQRPQRAGDPDAAPRSTRENVGTGVPVTGGVDNSRQRPQRAGDPDAAPRSTRANEDAGQPVTGGVDNSRQRPQRAGDPDAAPRSSQTGGKININTASQAELESLLGIGPVKAQAIIEGRPYRSVDEVMNVKGIKEGTYEDIRDRITVR